MSNEVILGNNVQELAQKESLLSTTVGDYQKQLYEFLDFLRLLISSIGF